MQQCSWQGLGIGRCPAVCRHVILRVFTSGLGQTQKWPCLHGTSVVPSRADVVKPHRQVRSCPTLKSASGEPAHRHHRHDAHHVSIGMRTYFDRFRDDFTPIISFLLFPNSCRSSVKTVHV